LIENIKEMRKAKPKRRDIFFLIQKFKETLVTSFVNYLMEDGKKSIAYKIFYDAVELVEAKTR
jgi:small subunit ribosomal protein S7